MQHSKPFLPAIRSIEFECLRLDQTEDNQTPNIIFLNGYRMKFKCRSSRLTRTHSLCRNASRHLCWLPTQWVAWLIR